MIWQRWARAGVGVFAVLFAAGVYFALGQRPQQAPLPPVERRDPAALSEVVGGILERFSGPDSDFIVHADSQLSYADGSEKLRGIRIELKKRSGRDFLITADEATIGTNESTIDLQGSIELGASDGFTLNTDRATFDMTDHVLRAPGLVMFTRGRMLGAGTGMTYDEQKAFLTLDSGSEVAMTDEAGAVTTSFRSGGSSLDRASHVLALTDMVHVVRGGQAFDSARAVAHLSDDDEVIRFVELRGDARVTGSESIDAMRAQEIDIDYTDDGSVIERVLMRHQATAALASAAAGAPGREISGDRLDLGLAADGSVSSIEGTGGVRLILPATGGAPPRTVTARELTAAGMPGKGLTRVEFTDQVEFREGARAERQARSQSLRLALEDDTIGDATFRGQASFRDGTLEARAGEARYSPAKGTLTLSGGAPEVADEQVIVNGARIEVEFDTRHMVASGGAKTTYKAAPAGGRGARTPTTRMPGLLEGGQPVTVNAASLDYTGAKGRAEYSGDVELRQGTGTFIRADRLAMNQELGDIVASGNARATLVREGEAPSTGTANEIRYTDRTRSLSYDTPAPGRSRLDGAQGDLRAGRIDIALAAEGSRVARIEAQRAVTIQVATHTISGPRLEYVAPPAGAPPTASRYVVQGDPRNLVTVLTRNGSSCTPASAMKLTMSGSADNITLEGQTYVIPRSEGASTCPPASPR